MKIWKTIKREILFAEKMNDTDLFLLFLMCVAAIPVVIGFTWLVFAVGYAFQGI